MSGPATQLKRAVLKRAGQAYLAGAAPSDAVMIADAVHDLGHRATLCYWNAPGDAQIELRMVLPADGERAAAASPMCGGRRCAWPGDERCGRPVTRLPDRGDPARAPQRPPW